MEEEEEKEGPNYMELLREYSPLTTLSGIFVMIASVLIFVAQVDDQIIGASNYFLIAGTMGMILFFVCFLQEVFFWDIKDEDKKLLKAIFYTINILVFLFFAFAIAGAFYKLLLSEIFSDFSQGLLAVIFLSFGLYMPLLLYEYVFEQYVNKHIKFFKGRFFLVHSVLLILGVLFLYFLVNHKFELLYDLLFPSEKYWILREALNLFFMGFGLGIMFMTFSSMLRRRERPLKQSK